MDKYIGFDIGLLPMTRSKFPTVNLHLILSPPSFAPRFFGAVRPVLCLLRLALTKHLFVLVTGTGTVMPHLPRNGIYAAMIPDIEATIVTLPDRLLTSLCFHFSSCLPKRCGSGEAICRRLHLACQPFSPLLFCPVRSMR